jgi:hypothetical protein
MRTRRFYRYTLTSCVAAALLAGCGGSQPSFGTPGVGTESTGTAKHAGPGRKTRSGELLYVFQESSGSGKVYVITFPQGTVIGTGTFAYLPDGSCSDASGDVFVTTRTASDTGEIDEFMHGGTTPVSTLSDSGDPQGCSVDVAGDLAVANSYDASAPGHPGPDVAIYAGAQGQPTRYAGNYVSDIAACTYDSAGNLFVGGPDTSGRFALEELPQGTETMVHVQVDAEIPDGLRSIQWDGHDVAVTMVPYRHGPSNVYRLRVSESVASLVGTTHLKTHTNNKKVHSPFSWINGPDLAVPTFTGVGFWAYPKGGRGTDFITFGGGVNSVTFSVGT